MKDLVRSSAWLARCRRRWRGRRRDRRGDRRGQRRRRRGRRDPHRNAGRAGRADQKDAVDPEDVETLQDLVRAALADALARSKQLAADRMGPVTGGLKIPGL